MCFQLIPGFKKNYVKVFNTHTELYIADGEHRWQTTQLNHSELMLDIWHQCTVSKCQHVHKENCGLSVVWSLRSKVSSWFLNNYSVRFWHVMVMAVAAVSSQAYRAKAFHITTEAQHTSIIRQEHAYISGAVRFRCLHFDDHYIFTNQDLGFAL